MAVNALDDIAYATFFGFECQKAKGHGQQGTETKIGESPGRDGTAKDKAFLQNLAGMGHGIDVERCLHPAWQNGGVVDNGGEPECHLQGHSHGFLGIVDKGCKHGKKKPKAHGKHLLGKKSQSGEQKEPEFGALAKKEAGRKQKQVARPKGEELLQTDGEWKDFEVNGDFADDLSLFEKKAACALQGIGKTGPGKESGCHIEAIGCDGLILDNCQAGTHEFAEDHNVDEELDQRPDQDPE